MVNQRPQLLLSSFSTVVCTRLSSLKSTQSQFGYQSTTLYIQILVKKKEEREKGKERASGLSQCLLGSNPRRHTHQFVYISVEPQLQGKLGNMVSCYKEYNHGSVNRKQWATYCIDSQHIRDHSKVSYVIQQSKCK